MQQTQLSTLKEVRTHGTKAFPCAVYQTRSAKKGTLVKHHWHNEVEILYFFGGEFHLEINMEQFAIRSECLYFINPGELHSIITEKSVSPGEDAIVFDPQILSFVSNDTAQVQLLSPIQSGKLLFPRCLAPTHPAFTPLREAFTDVIRSFGRQPTEMSPLEDRAVTEDLTRQLFIKSSLLRILAVLSDHRLFTPTERNYDKRIEGIKTVLTYIRENYKEKIYIHDLAELISMNEQYFCRFFRKALGRSPMEYVSEYRIRQSVRLLEETDMPVTEVCLESGYNNLGNFLREFKKQMMTTPLQYRRHFISDKHLLNEDYVSKKS